MWPRLQDCGRAGFDSRIGGDTGNVFPARCSDAGDRGIELRAVAPGDDDRGTLGGELARDLKTDAGGRAGHQHAFSVQLHIHGLLLLLCCVQPKN